VATDNSGVEPNSLSKAARGRVVFFLPPIRGERKKEKEGREKERHHPSCFPSSLAWSPLFAMEGGGGGGGGGAVAKSGLP